MSEVVVGMSGSVAGSTRVSRRGFSGFDRRGRLPCPDAAFASPFGADLDFDVVDDDFEAALAFRPSGFLVFFGFGNTRSASGSPLVAQRATCIST